MEILLVIVGVLFLITGTVALIKTGFSEQSLYSWRMGLLVGGAFWIGLYFLLRNSGNVLLSLPGSGILSVVLAVIGSTFLIWRKKLRLCFTGYRSLASGSYLETYSIQRSPGF